ncbi:ATP-binding protein [Rhizobiaceae bacterium BDR2-2]|uniref:histidine kinase n=1 Tax=Ectorhizobium quercum TaxID=2965071 RepID=A0AAE3MV26_9HYPH|nr:ATP-binding protein [Ectorhizobium quercum]MCX8995703.1 ATP-binding protein [Ectorhizobium quercum]
MGIPTFGLRTIRGQIMLIVVFAIVFVLMTGRLLDRVDTFEYVTAADVDLIGQRAHTLSLLLQGAGPEDRQRIVTRAAEAGIDLDIVSRRQIDALPKPEDFQSRIGRLVTYLFPPDMDLPAGASMIVYETRRAFAMPIDDDDALIYKSVPDTMLTTDLTGRVLYSFLSFVTLVGLFSVFAVRAITAPLKSIAGKLQDTEAFIAQPQPLEENGSVEIIELTRALNEMRSRIRDMIESRTRMLRSVSHDLRTPLTRARMRAERIGDSAVRDQILSDIAQVNALINATLDFLRDDRKTEKRERTDIASVMQTICFDFSDMGGAITYEGPARLVWPCKPGALTRAITNLCENGLKFATQVQMVLREDGASLRIEILDDGPGIPKPFRHEVLEPFFKMDAARTRGTDQTGFGLGLSIVDEIVRDHGGVIVFDDNVPHGLRVSIVLPRHEAQP